MEVAAWFTTKGSLAIAMKSVRGIMLLLRVHDTVTTPGPVPDEGEAIMSLLPLFAFQLPPVQPAGEPEIVTSCDPADDAELAKVGLIEKLVQEVCTASGNRRSGDIVKAVDGASNNGARTVAATISSKPLIRPPACIAATSLLEAAR